MVYEVGQLHQTKLTSDALGPPPNQGPQRPPGTCTGRSGSLQPLLSYTKTIK